MTFSFLPNHPERGAFAASAICRHGVVRVRMRGRLAIRRTETSHESWGKAHASTLKRMAESVQRFFSIALRSRPRLDHKDNGRADQNFCGPLDRWSSIHPRIQLRQKSLRGFTKCLETPRLCSVAPGFHEQQNTMGLFPDETKSEARPGNLTARDGNAAG